MVAASPPSTVSKLSILPSARELAFALLYGSVHCDRTEKLNEGAWSYSPRGFSTTETRDYRHTIPVLHRTPVWHPTMNKCIHHNVKQDQHSEGFLCGENIQESKKARSALKHATLAIYWKGSVHDRNGRRKIPSSTGVISSTFLSGI